MGRYADVSQSFIHRLCAGEKRSCKPRTAERIAEALDVPVGLLVVLTNPQMEYETAPIRRFPPNEKPPPGER
jgi:hypothetical protein